MSYNIPEITRESIDAWVHDARPTGGFLRAVLSNDLRESFARADLENRGAMFDIVSYLYKRVPQPLLGLAGSGGRVAWGDRGDAEDEAHVQKVGH